MTLVTDGESRGPRWVSDPDRARRPQQPGAEPGARGVGPAGAHPRRRRSGGACRACRLPRATKPSARGARGLGSEGAQNTYGGAAAGRAALTAGAPVAFPGAASPRGRRGADEPGLCSRPRTRSRPRSGPAPSLSEVPPPGGLRGRPALPRRAEKGGLRRSRAGASPALPDLERGPGLRPAPRRPRRQRALGGSRSGTRARAAGGGRERRARR